MIRLRTPIEVMLNISVLVAAALNLLAGVELWRTWLEPLDVPQASMPAPTSAARTDNQPESVPSTQVRTIDRYAGTLERPLFEWDRRTWVPPPLEIQQTPSSTVPAPTNAPQELPADLKLVGVHISTDVHRALIRTATASPPIWLGIGEKVAGWVVRKVEHNQVTLHNGAESRVLTLYVEK